jgi:hypothetical protein
MITLEEKFDGHIILYCKGHYNLNDVGFIVGLQRIWAVRCAVPVDSIRGSFNEYMADKMHEIFAKCRPTKLPYFHQILHKGLCDEWQYKGLSAIERVIMIYRNELMQLQIKEHNNGKFKTLIKLPKPQKRLFKRIVSGKGQSNDYKLVKE